MQNETRYAKIKRFFTATEDLMNGSYQNAEEKFAEMLKAIAASNELKQLLEAATHGFDYPAAKRAYLKMPSIGAARGSAYLPSDRKDILAFVFCLIVEIDAGNISFSNFLLRYFYIDGSYTASFSAFSERMIRPFHDIIRECFPADRERKIELELLNKQSEEAAGRVVAFFRIEETALANEAIDSGELARAGSIIREIYAAANRRDMGVLNALLVGYRYFLLVFGNMDRAAAVSKLIGEN